VSKREKEIERERGGTSEKESAKEHAPTQDRVGGRGGGDKLSEGNREREDSDRESERRRH